MKRRSALKSKTVRVNVLTALALLWPQFDNWIATHPRQAILSVLVLNTALRWVSQDRLSLEIPPMLKRLLPFQMLAAVAFVLMGAAHCAQIPIDRGVSAAEGRDQTIVIAGYGSASQKGYLFVQLNEHASVDDSLTLTFPVVKCSRESCVRFQFFRRDGSAGYAGALAQGQAQARVPLSSILGHPGQAIAGDEGEYSVIAQVYYLAGDGQEHSMIGTGFVRVNVLSELYRPVACNDPNIAWKSKVGDHCEAQFTSAFRSVVCGSGCL